MDVRNQAAAAHVVHSASAGRRQLGSCTSQPPQLLCVSAWRLHVRIQSHCGCAANAHARTFTASASSCSTADADDKPGPCASCCPAPAAAAIGSMYAHALRTSATHARASNCGTAPTVLAGPPGAALALWLAAPLAALQSWKQAAKGKPLLGAAWHRAAGAATGAPRRPLAWCWRSRRGPRGRPSSHASRASWGSWSPSPSSKWGSGSGTRMQARSSNVRGTAKRRP